MRRMLLPVLCALSLPLAAVAPNQQGMNANDGFQANNLKLGLGWSQENQSAARAQLLQGSFEFFLSDRFGIRGNAGIPLSTAVSDMKYYPFMMGGAFHLFPRFWFDLYLGADAGFVHIAAPNLPASWSTRVTPVVGVTLYYWGVFFLEGEAGYSVLQYAKDSALDLSAPTFRVRMGFYL
ncbi:MAG: hypothetical protein J0L53_06315 [Spirochaetes bacterium]|nr:hypothetical protein [Spirochaetota bacterium]MBN8550158.1 hypothetical protein [Deltaproteobacteria bacterium]MBX3722984.1 hypothetical protein [Turneriella sp.]